MLSVCPLLVGLNIWSYYDTGSFLSYFVMLLSLLLRLDLDLRFSLCPLLQVFEAQMIADDDELPSFFSAWATSFFCSCLLGFPALIPSAYLGSYRMLVLHVRCLLNACKSPYSRHGFPLPLSPPLPRLVVRTPSTMRAQTSSCRALVLQFLYMRSSSSCSDNLENRISFRCFILNSLFGFPLSQLTTPSLQLFLIPRWQEVFS